MKKPVFNAEGIDSTTFTPFVLHDCRETDTEDLRLEFANWEWLEERYGDTELADYDFSGEGVEDLVRAARRSAGLEVYPEGIEYNSDSDTCDVHFVDLDEAARTAELCSEMFNDETLLANAIEAVEAEADDLDDDDDDEEE